jgi:hypothetical protein
MDVPGVMAGAYSGRMTLTDAEFASYVDMGTVLARRGDRPVMLRHDDPGGGLLITRIWWPKGLITSAWLWPYHERFQRALTRLPELGFTVPVYRAHGRLSRGGSGFVVYERLAGVTLRNLGRDLDVRALGVLVAALHRAGVYCRGLNLGSVLRLDDGGLGLVDLQDVRFHARQRPLPLRMRERNLGILCSHPHDAGLLEDGRWSELVMAYCRESGFSLDQAARLRDRVRLQMQRRRALRLARRLRRQAPDVGPVTDKMPAKG